VRRLPARRANGAEAIAVRADVSKVEDGNRAVKETLRTLRSTRFLICNAGIWQGDLVESISEELWDRTLAINLKGTWTVCRAAVPLMKQQEFGRIVIVSSTAGQRGEATVSNYAASKGGQISFTKSLAAELAPFRHQRKLRCAGLGRHRYERKAFLHDYFKT
jgi:NAD(P)-dependent dehydrogenase (short-subunit alcohol dehydrogenase family)